MILFIGIILVAIISYKLKMLTLSGAITSVVVGEGILLGTGLEGLLLLGTFFVTSSLLSKWKKHQRKKSDNIVAKGSTRDGWQVLANGLGATFFSVLYYCFPLDIYLYGFILSLAIATSDTWASEIGVLSKVKPIHIRTFKRVESGISGAISSLGTMMSLLGSALIVLLGMIFFQLELNMVLLLIILGFAGCMVDTILGAFWQISYICSKCHLQVETKIHCGVPTSKPTGVGWMDNDIVNLISTFVFSIVSVFFIQLLS